jgi:hypothetical protein
LATEGHEEKSLDKEFYAWVLGDPTVAIVPLGSCTSVMAAVRHTGIWERVAQQAVIAGVIDSDYRADDAGAGGPPNCVKLPLHEVESYLCHPDVVADVARALKNRPDPPTRDAVAQMVVSHCEAQLSEVVGQRAGGLLSNRIDFTRPAGSYKGKGDEELRAAFRKAAEEEFSRLRAKVEKEIDRCVVSQFRACRKALDDRDIGRILALFPVKALMDQFAKMTLCPHPRSMLYTITQHLKVDDYPHLRELRESLRRALQLTR